MEYDEILYFVAAPTVAADVLSKNYDEAIKIPDLMTTATPTVENEEDNNDNDYNNNNDDGYSSEREVEKELRETMEKKLKKLTTMIKKQKNNPGMVFFPDNL